MFNRSYTLNASEGTRLTVGLTFVEGHDFLVVEIENIHQGTSIQLIPDDWDDISYNLTTIIENMTIEYDPRCHYKELYLSKGIAKIITKDDGDVVLLIGRPSAGNTGHTYLSELSVITMHDLYDAVWVASNRISLWQQRIKTVFDKVVTCIRERKACVHELMTCIRACMGEDQGIEQELLIDIRGEFIACMNQLFAHYCTPQSKCHQCD